MKRERRWFQIGSGLALSLVSLMILPACKPLIEVKVDATCGPERETNSPPTGPSRSQSCDKNPDGSCMSHPKNCVCK